MVEQIRLCLLGFDEMLPNEWW